MSADRLRELIARLEKAGEPAYALDCAIEDYRSGRDGWGLMPPPAYTGLIDKALLLVPRHHLWQIRQGFEASAIVWMLETDYDERNPPTGYATKFPALALCIAALKAQLEQVSRTESASVKTDG